MRKLKLLFLPLLLSLGACLTLEEQEIQGPDGTTVHATFVKNSNLVAPSVTMVYHWMCKKEKAECYQPDPERVDGKSLIDQLAPAAAGAAVGAGLALSGDETNVQGGNANASSKSSSSAVSSSTSTSTGAGGGSKPGNHYPKWGR